eukprot:6775862-Prymnesium_polylepis.1
MGELVSCSAFSRCCFTNASNFSGSALVSAGMGVPSERSRSSARVDGCAARTRALWWVWARRPLGGAARVR